MMKPTVCTLTAFVACVFAAVSPIQAQDYSTLDASFSGELTPEGCEDSGRPLIFSGQIAGGRVSGRAMRGQTFDWGLTSDGRFGGELFLRKHRRGDKMQSYQGRISGDRVIVDAEFGVPGHAQTFCTAHGELALD